MGRSAELERIEALLDGARGAAAGVLVIEGEPGIGKTALLREARARAEGFSVLSARGVESEAGLAHGGLLELLHPVRDRLADVPPTQAAALGAALGWGGVAAGADRYLVGAGVLSLLAAAAEGTPLLVVIDDLHWIDAESAAAVLFAARRMHSDGVAFVFAARPSNDNGYDGLEVLELSGLAQHEARAITPADVAATVLAELVERVNGNPLALLETAPRLTPAQRRGTAPLPDVLSVGRRLEDVFAPVLDGLSTEARESMVLLAASHDPRAADVVVALASPDGTAALGLVEAERRNVVIHDGSTLQFRHPLLRSAVWGAATPEQQRAAHQRLAAANSGDPVARTWHRAQAATGHDDGLATELVAVAAEARRRHGFAAAAAATVRAASLVTDVERGAALLAAAVTDSFMSGDIEQTRTLATRVRRAHAGERSRGEALYALGLTEQYAGSVPAARELLMEAADLTDGRMRTWALTELAFTQHRLGDTVGMQRTAQRMLQDSDGAGPEQRALTGLISGMTALLAGEFEAGLPALGEALNLMESDPSLRDEPRLLCFALIGHAYLGDVVEVAPALERRLQVARDRGALGVLVTALALFANGRASLLGDHVGAFADAGEAVELAQQLQYVADAAPAVELLAWEYAARGLHDDAQQELRRARDLVTRAGTVEVAAHFAETVAFCALCRGDLTETVAVIEARIAADGGVGSMGEPLGLAPLLVEAYVGLGRGADANALAARYAEAAAASPMPATQALVARCLALGADDDDVAVAEFERALEAHAQAPDRFETAHTQLLYGARLRRSGRRKDAREQLRSAGESFAAADLTAWAQRAEHELKATGESPRSRGPSAQEPLTSQETRVALLAAQGLSNRDIAGALFLSPKTIEHHLSSVYRKRGLRSRAQLAHLLHQASPA